MKWEPANRKWSPTIRIDDYCYSTNFYISIDLLCHIEKLLLEDYMELPPDDGIVPILASNLLDSNKVPIGIDNIGRTLIVCILKPEVDID